MRTEFRYQIINTRSQRVVGYVPTLAHADLQAQAGAWDAANILWDTEQSEYLNLEGESLDD